MKRTGMLLVVMMFTAGMVFAQNNTADIDQSGNNNSADVDQFGYSNFAEIVQSGNDDIAEIDQSGNENQASIEQSQGGSGARSAEGYIDQQGDGNVASQEQRIWSAHNTILAIIDQVGFDNTATQNQNTGTSVRAEISQQGYDNVASQTQEFTYGFSSALIDQVGDGNQATQLQNSRDSEAVILQEGLDNVAAQTQSGRYNDAEIAQYGAENQASITQDGENNTAVIEQGAWGGSENSVANFTQTGNGNYFETTMVRSYDNTVTGVQEGDDNYFRAGVRGYDNVVTMDVFGDANRGSWSIGSIGWPHQPADNELTINVIGSDNYSSGVIAGDENVVNILQHGNGNRIGTSWHTADGVNIQGDRNTVSIQQYSDYNSASVTVVGHGNTASIVQD